MMSEAPILMMLHPMELAEFSASVWFSWMVKTFNLPLFMALSSTVFGTEVLISLLIGGNETEKERDEQVVKGYRWCK